MGVYEAPVGGKADKLGTEACLPKKSQAGLPFETENDTDLGMGREPSEHGEPKVIRYICLFGRERKINVTIPGTDPFRQHSARLFQGF
jgi:hypothetical protein